MRNFLQLFLVLSLFLATSLDLSAQLDLTGTVSYVNGTFVYDSGTGSSFRVCPDVPISLNSDNAASVCAGLGGVDRSFFVTGSTGGGDQTEITPEQPGNIVRVVSPVYFRFCVRCNNGDMIESDIITFFPSSTTEEGEDCAGVILPVELTSFTGNNVEAGIALEWTTDSEVNNEGFEVEFSLDARSFETVGFITGNGTTNEPQSYQYIHKTNRPGSLYYRLKQMDFDGAYEYSDLIEVMREKENDGTIVIFPNPAREAFTITVSNPERLSSSVKVTDLLGKVIFSTSFQADEAPDFFEKEISSLTQQMYIVTTRIGTEVTSHQVANLN